MLYTEKINERNGFSIILSKAVKTKTAEVIRKSDRIILVKLVQKQV